ncbi:MAG: hypothetical protein M5U01_20880 [Ardenticatenaceae bacterium]|nr:hypothetical protein [Ardenticatenaceae bacterium]HBY97579.1 hypothetical protein [Chloroflexota bacterium]
MSETMELIQRLSNERQRLWLLAGQGKATPADRRRIEELTRELYNLWDSHRREIAARRMPREAGAPNIIDFPAVAQPAQIPTPARKLRRAA